MEVTALPAARLMVEMGRVRVRVRVVKKRKRRRK